MSNLSMVEAKLPPGFRFHPRDEELICDYLMKKVTCCECPLLIEVDLNKSEPWDIPRVEIEAEEKKIPANENELILVPETNSFGQNFRSGIDPPVATFAGAALPVVKMPSEGSENSIEVPSCSGSACGCKSPCPCKPCYC